MLASDPAVERVVGVDVAPPAGPAEGIQFIRADLRTRNIAAVVEQAAADTIVHAATLPPPGARSAGREIVVLGTMQLLAACQRSQTLRAFVLQSSTAGYGAGPRDPALFTEEMGGAVGSPPSGRSHDVAEIEDYVRGFAERRPDVRVCVLRLAHLVGPGVQTALNRYLLLPIVPTMLGFDARLQLVHEDDAVGALAHATLSDAAGAYNIAADGVLFLSQAIRRLGRVAVPVPAPLWPSFVGMLGGRGLSELPSSGELTYGRVADTARMTAEFGFTPAHSAQTALAALRDRPHQPVEAHP